MASSVPDSDMQAFYDFLGRLLVNAGELTPEQSVREFRVYQEELKRFLRDSQSAFANAANGRGGQLDVDAIMQRVAKRLADEGLAS